MNITIHKEVQPWEKDAKATQCDACWVLRETMGVAEFACSNW